MNVLKIAVQEVHAIRWRIEHVIDNIVHAAHAVSIAHRWAEVTYKNVVVVIYAVVVWLPNVPL